jgi:predicted GIY-YIG superfamily endonuclease
MYYVYIVKLTNGKLYTGSTSELKARIDCHNGGKVLSTKAFRPVKLVFYCAFPSKSKAIMFELYLKTGSGNGFRNKHLV